MRRTDARFASLALVVLAAAAAGCGSARSAGAGPDASLAELEALYAARADSARMLFVEADIRFLTDMIAHHAQALVMAELAETHGASPSVRVLASRIINGQRDEIATMQAWLRDRGQPVPEVHVDGLDVMLHMMEPGAHAQDHAAHAQDHAADAAGHMLHGADMAAMPGMLTLAELRELDAARGREFDRLFLSSMIRHHRGALEMVDAYFKQDGVAQDHDLFRMAADIQSDQTAEIARMESMLAALTGPGAAP